MPKVARFPKKWWSMPLYAWVPGHELAHALLATSEQLTKRRLGLHKLATCACRNRVCWVVEAAATYISTTWHAAIGRFDLRDEELKPEVTPYVSQLRTRNMRRRVLRLLKQKNLWPLPMTVEEVEAAFAAKKE